MTQNLREKFKESTLNHSQKIAIQHKKNDKWISVYYSDLGRNAENISALLQEEKAGKGEKVAILLDNRSEWPAIFFATVSIGAISIPIDYTSRPEEIENILKNSECKLIFTSEDLFSLAEGLRKKCPFLKKVISVDSAEFKNRIEKLPAESKNVQIDPDDLACILYTSGTTAEPKGVMLTHGNLLANCASVQKLNLVTSTDSVVSVLPLHHSYPLTGTVIFPLLNGGRIIYPGTMRSEDILKAMRETKATVFFGVPQIYYSFHQKIAEVLLKIPFPVNLIFKLIIKALYGMRKKTGINLARYFLYGVHRKFGRSMRLFISGGAKLDEKVEEAMFRLGFTVLEGYGLTETSPVLTFNPLKRPKIGSAGTPIPDVEIRLADKDEKGIGEVIARGPNIMKGYYKREDLSMEVIKGGWFHTGDLGYIDKDGYLFLTGRLKEVIVLSSGVNVYPEEVEEAYSVQVPCKEMCVFEVPAKKGKEESLALWAVIVPDLEFFKKYGEVNLKDVIRERLDNVSRILPPHKRVMGFHITLDELPHTLLGKIKRFAVKEVYTPIIMKEKEEVLASGEISKEDLEIMKTGTGQKIINYLKEQTTLEKDITPQDLLELDLGIDSLGRIELASGLEKTFGIKIKDEIIGKAFTVRDLIKGTDLLLKDKTEALSEDEKGIDFGPDYWKDLFKILPKKENLAKIDLHPGFGAWLGGFIFTGVFYVIFKVFYRLEVEGKENLPKEGPCILYANHTSYLDGFLVAASLPNFPKLDLFFVGFRPYFDVPVIRNLVKIGRIIPLDFSAHLLEAMRSCYYVLNNGKTLCLFPEGIRSLDGNVGKFKKGFGILAKEAKSKLVPVMLEGAYEAWPRTSKFPKRHPLKVSFAKALSIEETMEDGYKLGAKDDYEAICLAAKERLLKLKKDTGGAK